MSKKTSIPTQDLLADLPVKVDLRLLTDRLSHYKHPRKKVFDLAHKGDLEFIARGHYLNLRSKSLEQTPLEALANAIYFPSYVSGAWALQHYGVLSERVQTITSVTSRKSVAFETSLGRFEFNHLHQHRYAFGYESHPEHGYLIARPEKALLDYLKLGNHELSWDSDEQMLEYFAQNLRIDLDALLAQTTADQLRELLPHFHRNAPEARTLKRWIALISEPLQPHLKDTRHG